MSYIGNPINSVAFLTDQFSGNGSTTAFTMSVAPANTASVLVAVSGVVQDPSTYSVVGTTLTFSAAPPSGTGNVSVRYLGIPAAGVTTTAYRTVTDSTATAGQTTFSVPSYTVGYINVYRNGVRLGDAVYTASSGTTVVLASGAAAGDLITTESFYVSSVLNAIANTNGSVTQLNLAPNVAGNGPAFAANSASPQAIANNSWTKLTITVEVFDSNSNYDAANSKFQPTIGGYYQINIHSAIDSGVAGAIQALRIYKNGSPYTTIWTASAASQYCGASTSQIVYLNGSTDYVEGYFFHNVGASRNTLGGDSTFISGSLVRAA